MARKRLQLISWNLASEIYTDEVSWLTGKMWRFRSFHGNMNDLMQPWISLLFSLHKIRSLLNFSNYQVMSLGPRNCHKDLHIVINDTIIDLKPEITLLEVVLDDQLSFSSHVSNICRKASSQTGVLLILRNLIPKSAKLHIVKFANMLPHLMSSYCLAFLSFFWRQETRTNSRTSTARRALW